MRFYIYNLLVTFDIKNFKLLKNALIFTALGIGRNLLALLGIILLVVIHILLIFLFLPLGISIPIILPFFYLLAATSFMATYAAYPVIDKYMIAPYLDEKGDDEFVYFKENTDESSDTHEEDSTNTNTES
jgi:hypothetical protein